MENDGYLDNAAVPTFFFTFVDILVISSLFLPEWIVSNVGGKIQIGLWKSCIFNRKSSTPKCLSFNPPFSWKLSIVFIIFGCIFCSVAVGMFIRAWKNPVYINHGRWMGIFTLLCFSIASLLIPIGFSMEQIQGELFQLPSSFNVI